MISKNTFFYFFLWFLFFGCDTKQETITISGAFGLYPMAIKWAEEYNKIYPDIRIDISAGGAGKGMTDVLYENVDLAMLSRDVSERELLKGAYPIIVAKDAVVPTFNFGNPFREIILKRGLTKKEFYNIYIEEKYQTWEEILSGDGKTALHAYTRSDAAGAPETWAKFLGKKQEDLKGIGVFGDPGLADAVKSDKSAIGFNNAIFVYDMNTKTIHPGLMVIPLDLDENGKIDSVENFYGSLPELIDAAAKGIYPSPPGRELYFVTKGLPKRKVIIEFLNWVLGPGQLFVLENGYIRLTPSVVKDQLSRLEAP